jgi:hypothetical protein
MFLIIKFDNKNGLLIEDRGIPATHTAVGVCSG